LTRFVPVLTPFEAQAHGGIPNSTGTAFAYTRGSKWNTQLESAIPISHHLLKLKAIMKNQISLRSTKPDIVRPVRNPNAWIRTFLSLSVVLYGHAAMGAEPTRTTAPNQSMMFTHSNQTVMLSATVSPPSNEGTVQFTLERINRSTGQLIPVGDPVASRALTNGFARVSYVVSGALTPGGYSIQAEYSGSSNFLASHHVESILTILPPGSRTLKTTNATPIVIPIVGQASLYPSVITVTGAVGPITNAALTLNGLTHPYPADLDIFVVAPGGQRVALFSNVGGGHSLSNVDVTLSDWASFPLPLAYDTPSGTYQPTVYPRTVTNQFAIPRPFSTNLSSLNGLSPNGTWSLFVLDVEAPDAGIISRGWTLALTTAMPRPSLQISQTGPNCFLSFATFSNANYFVECKDSFSDLSWILLKQVAGTGASVMVSDTRLDASRRFYRVRVE